MGGRHSATNDQKILIGKEALIVLNSEKGRTLKMTQLTRFPHGFDGLRIWEAGIVLARYAILNRQFFTDKFVLEVGSGTGIAGLSVLKFTSCKNCLLSDYLPEVVENARRNCQANGMKKAIVMKLNWKDYTNFINRYDIIIGSEVVSPGAPTKQLYELLKQFLVPGGRALFVVPNKEGYIESLLGHVQRTEFEVESVELKGMNYAESPLPNKVEGFECFPGLTSETYMLYTLKKMKGAVVEEANLPLRDSRLQPSLSHYERERAMTQFIKPTEAPPTEQSQDKQSKAVESPVKPTAPIQPKAVSPAPTIELPVRQEPETQPQKKPKIQPKIDVQPQPKVDAQPQQESQPEAQPQPQPKSEPQPQPQSKPEVQPQPEPEPLVQLNPQPESQPQQQPPQQQQPQLQQQPQQASHPEAQPKPIAPESEQTKSAELSHQVAAGSEQPKAKLEEQVVNTAPAEPIEPLIEQKQQTVAVHETNDQPEQVNDKQEQPVPQGQQKQEPAQPELKAEEPVQQVARPEIPSQEEQQKVEEHVHQEQQQSQPPVAAVQAPDHIENETQQQSPQQPPVSQEEQPKPEQPTDQPSSDPQKPQEESESDPTAPAAASPPSEQATTPPSEPAPSPSDE